MRSPMPATPRAAWVLSLWTLLVVLLSIPGLTASLAMAETVPTDSDDVNSPSHHALRVHDVEMAAGAPGISSWHVKLIGKPKSFLWHQSLPLFIAATDLNFVAAVSSLSGSLLWRTKVYSRKDKFPTIASCGSFIISLSESLKPEISQTVHAWHAHNGKLEFTKVLLTQESDARSLSCRVSKSGKLTVAASFAKNIAMLEYSMHDKAIHVEYRTVELISNIAQSAASDPAYLTLSRSADSKEPQFEVISGVSKKNNKHLPIPLNDKTSAALICSMDMNDSKHHYVVAYQGQNGRAAQIFAVTSDLKQANQIAESEILLNNVVSVTLADESTCVFQFIDTDGKKFFFTPLAGEKISPKLNDATLCSGSVPTVATLGKEANSIEFYDLLHGSATILSLPAQESTVSRVECMKKDSITLVTTMNYDGNIRTYRYSKIENTDSIMTRLWVRYEMLANLTQVKALDFANSETDELSEYHGALLNGRSQDSNIVAHFFNRYVNRLIYHAHSIYLALQFENIVHFVKSTLISLDKSKISVAPRARKLVLGLANSHVVAIDSADPHQIHWISDLLITGEKSELIIDEQTATSHDVFKVAGNLGTQVIDARSGKTIESTSKKGAGTQEMLASRNATHAFTVHSSPIATFIIGYTGGKHAASVIRSENENYRVRVPGTFITTWSPSRASQPVTAPAGRVMTDRSVKFKYINRNLVVALSSSPMVSQKRARILHVLILDSINGRVLGNVDFEYVFLDTFDAHVTGAENAIIVTYFAKNARHEMWHSSVIELYVPESANQLEPNAMPWARPSHFDENLQLAAWSPELRVATYEIAAARDPVVDTAISLTRNGLSLRDILMLTESSLIKIPQGVLDALRTDLVVDSSAAEVISAPLEATPEGAIPFSVTVTVDDSKDVISRDLDLHSSKVSSHVTPFESTSIAICHLGDIYYTAISPSGDFDQLSASFPKLPLILACVVLFVATIFSRYYLRRKVLDAQWK